METVKPEPQTIEKEEVFEIELRDGYKLRPMPATIAPLVMYPNKDLKERCVEVEKDALNAQAWETVIMQMILTMYQNNGVGLSANQIGFPYRIIVFDTEWPDVKSFLPSVMFNPIMVDHSKETVSHREGCLSVGAQHFEIPRYEEVKIQWEDIEGKAHEEVFTGLNAICIQHELDHLDGKLYLDHLSHLKRDIINRRVKKIRKKAKRVASSASFQEQLKAALKEEWASHPSPKDRD